MPVFDSKSLDAAFEEQALLAAILQPTRAARGQALVNGRRRAKLGIMPAGPAPLAHKPLKADIVAPDALSAR